MKAILYLFWFPNIKKCNKLSWSYFRIEVRRKVFPIKILMIKSFHYENCDGENFIKSQLKIHMYLSGYKQRKLRWIFHSRQTTIRISWKLWWTVDWKDLFKSGIYGLRKLLSWSCELEKGVTTVSINEVRLAIENGIESSKIIFNGNGKTKIELLKAINYGVIINVDSKFDFENLLEAKGSVLHIDNSIWRSMLEPIQVLFQS